MYIIIKLLASLAHEASVVKNEIVKMVLNKHMLVMKLSIDALVKEMQPVVLEKYRLEFCGKFPLYALFG